MTIQESGLNADYGLTQRNLDAYMRKAQYLFDCGISEDVYIDEWRKVLDGTYEPPTEPGRYLDRDGEEWSVNAAGLYRYDPDSAQTGPVSRMAGAVTESAPYFPVPPTAIDAAVEFITGRKGDWAEHLEWLAEQARKAEEAGL